MKGNNYTYLLAMLPFGVLTAWMAKRVDGVSGPELARCPVNCPTSGTPHYGKTGNPGSTPDQYLSLAVAAQIAKPASNLAAPFR